MSALPPHKAGVGSAVNDLDRELGAAFGIGVLASVTLSYYRSRLASAATGDPASVLASARQGLAQAVAAGGGPGSPLGLAARHAYASGLDLAMAVGAVCVVIAAVAVFRALRTPAARGQAAGQAKAPAAPTVPAPGTETAPAEDADVSAP
jgi:hypothetical protein